MTSKLTLALKVIFSRLGNNNLREKYYCVAICKINASFIALKMLLKASEWAKQNNIKFPNINIGKFEGKPIEEVYVFGDDEDVYCPTIMHFVLVNRDFWKYEKPTGLFYEINKMLKQ